MQFCQTLRTSHLSLRAMAARVVALSEMAASVLNLIHPVGGGDPCVLDNSVCGWLFDAH